MKKLYLLFVLISGICFSQTQEVVQGLILNKNKAYIGEIATTEKIEVKILTIEAATSNTFKITGQTNVAGNLVAFNGEITVEDAENKRLKTSGLKFYKFKFLEEKGNEHTGELSGSLVMKIFNDEISISVFEGYWENYIKTIKHPVFFDNSNLIMELGNKK